MINRQVEFYKITVDVVIDGTEAKVVEMASDDEFVGFLLANDDTARKLARILEHSEEFQEACNDDV